jgi:regulator of sigma E protease
MDILLQLAHKAASSGGPFFLLLGLLIFVHELGHYLVAVYFGVRVETFSLGFGKKILSFKRGETTYCVSIIPLGGYVKMYGDDPTAQVPEAEKPYSFLHKPVGPRIAIVLAGPLMNLFFAILVFATVAMLGEEMPGSKIGDVSVDTAAYKAGFRSGDKILKVNEASVSQWKDVKEIIESHPEKTLHFSVQREDTQAIESVDAIPALKKNDFLFSTNRQVGKVEGLSLDAVSTMVGISDNSSAAALAGLKTLDVIEAINGQPVQYWRDIENLFSKELASTNVAPHKWSLTVRAYSEKSEAEASTREIKFEWPAKANSLAQLGLVRSDLFLLSVNNDSPAARAGLTAGDQVTHLNGQPVKAWQDVLDTVKSFQPEKKQISFTVVHAGQTREVGITPELFELPTEQGAMEKRFAIGVRPAILMGPNSVYLQKLSNPVSALAHGVGQAYEWSKLIAISFLRLIQNEVSAKNIGGVITIGRVASKSFAVGAVAFLKMMAVISINLFILNLLPVPVLDGGHLLFFSIEALRGAPISFRKMEIAQQVGLVLLLSLMIFALFNDITHLISSW